MYDRKKHEAKRQALFAVMSVAPYGETFSYQRITDIIGANSNIYRHIILQVQKRLEKKATRTLKNDWGRGYAIALPTEHINLAGKKHGRARKQLGRARSIIKATDKSQLNVTELKRLDDIEMNLKAQADAIRSLESRTDKVEKTVGTQSKISEVLLLRVADAIDRIELLERRSEIVPASRGPQVASEGRA